MCGRATRIGLLRYALGMCVVFPVALGCSVLCREVSQLIFFFCNSRYHCSDRSLSDHPYLTPHNRHRFRCCFWWRTRRCPPSRRKHSHPFAPNNSALLRFLCPPWARSCVVRVCSPHRIVYSVRTSSAIVSHSSHLVCAQLCHSVSHCAVPIPGGAVA